MKNSLIQNVNKIENKLKEHNFIIDYQNNSKDKFETYKKVFQNYDKIYAFWNMYNFEDFKNKYWNSINITDVYLKNHLFFRTLFSDYDFKNTWIEQDLNQWFIFSPEQTIAGENIHDQTNLLTCFSKRKLQNKQVKDILYSLETWLTYTKTIEKLLHFYSFRWSNSFKRSSLFNFELYQHSKIFQMIYWLKKFWFYFSENNLNNEKVFLKNQEKNYEITQILLRKNSLCNIFSQNFMFYLFWNSSFWTTKKETLEEIINKLQIWKLYDENTKKNINSQEEIDMKFKISWFIELFEMIISKYFLMLIYNEEKEINDQEWEKYISTTFLYLYLKDIYLIFKNASLYIVNELLKIKEDDELLKEIFTEEFIETEIKKKEKEKFDQNFETLSFQKHINTFIKYYWSIHRKEIKFWYFEDVFKFICFETKIFLYNSIYSKDEIYSTFKKQRFSFYWKVYEENKVKWEKVSEYLDVMFTFYWDWLKFLYKYIDWSVELNKYLNKNFEEKDTDEFYKFWYFWIFKMLYELIWELKYQYSKKQKNSSHAIYYWDTWISSALLEDIIFENNKVFLWEQEKIYLSMNSDLFWSWLIQNFSEVCSNIYQKYNNSYKEKILSKIYRWNWKFWYKNKESINRQIESIWIEYWTRYLSSQQHWNKKYQIVVSWLQWNQSQMKNEKIMKQFFENFSNEFDWFQDYIQLKFFQKVQKNVDNIIKKLIKLKDWFENNNEHKKILFFFDQVKFSQFWWFDSISLWFWKIYNETCDFVFTKNCLIWIWNEWYKNEKWNLHRIYWSAHFHNLNFIKYENNQIKEDKLYLPLSTKEKVISNNLQEIDLVWFRKKVLKDCWECSDFRHVYLQWFTWKKYIWFRLIELLYANWFITNVKNRKFIELLNVVDKQIINTNKKNNEYTDFEKQFRKKYKKIYFNETNSISISEQFELDSKRQKEYLSSRTFQFVLDEIFSKKIELNEENLQKLYFKYKKFLSDKTYWLLQYFSWIEYIKNALTECIKKDKKEKKRIYYLLLSDFIQTQNIYFWYEPFVFEEKITIPQNQSEFIKREILFWKLRKFWIENWITFINILSKNEINFDEIDENQTIVYYWDEESFLSKWNCEEINWIIFYNLDIEFSKNFEINMSSKNRKFESINWYKYKYYYVLHNLLKWWIFTEWNKKDNFHFYRLYTKWNISYFDFFKNYNIEQNNISFEKETNEKFEKELLSVKKYNLKKLNNKNEVFSLIEILIEEFLDKIMISDEYNLDWNDSSIYFQKTLFNKYEILNFFQEFSIIVMNIQKILLSFK